MGRVDKNPVEVDITGSGAAYGSQRWEWLALLVLLVLPFVVYFPVTTGDATFAGYDHTAINQPLKQTAFESARSGHLPLWEHRLDRGVPLFAEGEAGVFYPVNLLFLIPGDFLDIYNIVVLVLIGVAGLTFYWWIRRLGACPLAAFLAAAAFQWSAPVNFSKANMNIMEAWILAPVLLLLIEPTVRTDGKWGRPLLRTGGIGIVLAMMLFAGQSQYVVYSALFAVLYIILRTIFAGRNWISTFASMAVPFVGGAILGIGLAAVQLFPTIGLIPMSERAAGALAEGLHTHGLWLTPSRLFATFIFPAYHYSLDHFLPWLMTPVYAGPVAILLAGYAIRSCGRIRNPVIFPLLITGLIFLWLSMGANAPISREITSWEFLAHFRSHGRMGAYFVMAMMALMGLGLDAWFRMPCAEACDMVGSRKCVPLFLPELIILALLAIPFILRRAEYIETRNSISLMIGFLMILFSGVLIGHLVRSRTPLAWAVGLIIVVKMVGFSFLSSETILTRSDWDSDRSDLLYISEESQSPSKASMLAIPTRASELLHERIIRRGFQTFGQPPVDHIDYLGSGNAPLMEDLIVCNADLPLELERWEWLVHRNLMPEIKSADGPLPDRSVGLLYILGINWIVTENEALDIPGYERVENPDWTNRGIPYFIFRREYPPAEYTVYWQSTGVGTGTGEDTIRDEFLAQLDDPSLGSVVFLEDGEGAVSSGGISTEARRHSAVSGEWESPTRYVADVSVSERGIFLFRDAWYPGWSVTVNGEPAELLRANLVFKAVEIPAGQSEIVFSYRSQYLPAGWIVSAVSAFLILLLIGFGIRWVGRGKVRIKSSGHMVDLEFPVERS